MLTNAQMKIYYELAVQINNGQHQPYRVFEAFEEFPDEASEIVNFWLQFNELTQSVVHYLAIEKCRFLYEKCYKKEVSKWNLMKHKLRVLWKCRKTFCGQMILHVLGELKKQLNNLIMKTKK